MSGQLALAAGLIMSVLAVLVALVAAAAACLVLRRRVISRHGGVVECGLRPGSGARWRHGLAEYRSGQLHWHRSTSLRLRPAAAFDRAELVITGSRPARAFDAAMLGQGVLIVQCEVRPQQSPSADDPRIIELAMSEAALTGYLAWLEAAPSARHPRPAS